MSIFSTILDKLGIHKPAKPAEAPKPAPYSPISSPATPYTPVSGPSIVTPPTATTVSPIHYGPPTPATPASAAAPTPMAMVDVVSRLDSLAKKSTIPDLNWKQSIVDLLKVLGLPADAQAIKDLAVELGCPEKEMGDSYSRNVWTHKALLQKIAENGGNIPQNLLH
jgi:hypothetical protein